MLNKCFRDECEAKPCLQYCGPCNASLESLSDYESIRDELFRAKACVPDSGPFNAGVESYECSISVLEMNVRPNLAFNTVVLVTLV